jgi:hypothetical protein
MILLLCLANAGAEEGAKAFRTVIFHTDPDKADVVFLSDAGPQLLGTSGDPVQVPVPDRNVVLQFEFRREGYQKRHWNIDSTALRPAVSYNLPQDGNPVPLVPGTIGIYLRDAALRHLGVMGALVLSIGLGVAAFRRRQRQVVRASRRLVVAETLGGKVDLPRPDATLIGQKVGNWVLTDQLGKGGMAVVYRGLPHDTLDPSQAVAVKVINREYLASPEARARFEREVRIGAKLNHPNIVRVMDWNIGDPCYLVMELIYGVPLRQRVNPEGMVPRLALELLMPVFDAMIYAHQLGIWHRDLKPENVFVSAGTRITVMDFGISRQESDVTVTATDQMPVTPGYMSPEQFSGKGVAAPSDQYTLGIMLWELIVGHRPFMDDSPMVVVMKHVGSPLPAVREERPHVAEEVDWVLERMCSKDPLSRYPDLQSAVQALEEAILRG